MDKINRTYLSKPLAENNIWSYRVIPPTHSASQRYKCKILYLIISQRSKADFLFRFKPPPSKKPDQHSISYVHKANFLYSFIPPLSKKPISTAYHSFLKPIFCIALNRPLQKTHQHSISQLRTVLQSVINTKFYIYNAVKHCVWLQKAMIYCADEFFGGGRFKAIQKIGFRKL